MISGRPFRALLVGAGHTHLHVIDRAATLREAGVEIALLAPAFFDYSGYASAEATGALSLGAGRIDVAALAAMRGVAHTVGRAVGIDSPGGRVHVDDGSELAYDVVSLNLGSVVATGSMDVDPAVPSVKPFDRLRGLTHWLDGRDPVPRVTISVVGGGPTGIELAGHLSARLGRGAEIHVFERASEIGESLPPGARRRAARRLVERGVQLRTGSTVTDVAEDHLTLAGGHHRHDVAIVATGLTAPPIVGQLGLGDAHGIPVRDTLQTLADDDVYAVGDCAWFTPRPLEKIGVHAVRQGPVLVESLLARRHGRTLPTFRPRRQVLQIVSLGGGTAVATRGRWWLEGAAAARLKRAIDERWLARYR